MKRVLLPVDGSECSLRAVRRIIAKRQLYAQPEGLEIHLVNVQPVLIVDDTRFSIPPDDLAAYQRHESEREMTEARRLLDEAGAACSCHCLVGNVGEEIAKLASALECDQIVMGVHGRNPLETFLVGSTTHKVIHYATVPVLLVK